MFESFLPLSCELGTNKTVKARFWPWLSGESNPFSVVAPSLQRGYSLFCGSLVGGLHAWLAQEGRYEATCKKEFKLPWRKAGQLLIPMIYWIRTSRVSMKNSLSGAASAAQARAAPAAPAAAAAASSSCPRRAPPTPRSCCRACSPPSTRSPYTLESEN